MGARKNNLTRDALINFGKLDRKEFIQFYLILPYDSIMHRYIKCNQNHCDFM